MVEQVQSKSCSLKSLIAARTQTKHYCTGNQKVQPCAWGLSTVPHFIFTRKAATPTDTLDCGFIRQNSGLNGELRTRHLNCNNMA